MFLSRLFGNVTPMTLSVHLSVSVVGWLVDWSVALSKFLKGREVTFLCSYRNIFLLRFLVFNNNDNWEKLKKTSRHLSVVSDDLKKICSIYGVTRELGV